MNRGADSAARLAHLFHALPQTGRPEEAELAKRAMGWHKFIIDPEPIGDQMAPADFADDLRAHGLFRPPFDQFVIHMGPFLGEAQGGPFMQTSDFHGTVFAWLENGELHGRFYEVYGRSFKPNSGTSIYPLHIDRKEWVNSDSEQFFRLDELEQRESFMRDGKLMLNGKIPLPLREAIEPEKSLFALTVFQLVGLLGSDGIIDTAHKEPKYLNQKRAKQNRPPILGYHLLSVDHDRLKMPGVVSTGGTHASPRLHWRRGHVRKLATGRTTIVKPCLVGDPKRGALLKDYKVS